MRVATAKSALPIVAAIDPCYTTIPLAEDSAGRISTEAIGTILDAVADSDVVVFGPGIGQSHALRSIAERLIGIKGFRLVIDADGLNNLSRLKAWHQDRQGPPGPYSPSWRDEAALAQRHQDRDASGPPGLGRASSSDRPPAPWSSRVRARSSQTAAGST